MNINLTKEAINNIHVIFIDIDRILFTEEYMDSIFSLFKTKEVNNEVSLSNMREIVLFQDVLKAKIDLIQPNIKEIEIIQITDLLQFNPLISRLKGLIVELCKKGINVYLLSDVYQEMITPIASYLGLSIYNIYSTNNLNFDESGEYNGSTSTYTGKTEIIHYLVDLYNYKSIIMIGDEFSVDILVNPYACVEYRDRDENIIQREKGLNKSVWFIKDFQEIIDIIMDTNYKSKNKSIYHYDVEPWDDDWPWGSLDVIHK